MKIDRASFLVLTASIAAMSVAAGACAGADGDGSTGDDQNVTQAKSGQTPARTGTGTSCIDTTKPMTSVSPIEEGFCHSVTEGRGPSDDKSRVNTRCQVLKLAVKSAIAIPMRACLLDLSEHGADEGNYIKAMNACAVAALKTSCLNPTTEGTCKEMLRPDEGAPDPAEVKECKTDIGGLNDAYRDQVAKCVERFKSSPAPDLANMPFGQMFTSCIEGLVAAD